MLVVVEEGAMLMVVVARLPGPRWRLWLDPWYTPRVVLVYDVLDDWAPPEFR